MSQPTLLSPRLSALQTELERDPAALERFWQEIAEHGAPLIELDGSDQALVTFVWRGTPATTGVVVVQDWGADGLPEHHMASLPGSDVWHYTRRLPSDTRTSYQLWPLPTPEGEFHLKLDPLNPRTQLAYLGEDNDDIVFSLLELPDAPAQPWLDAAVPQGEVRLYDPAGDGRRVWAYTPPGLAAGPLPLLVFFDGRLSKDMLRVPAMLDYLIAAGRIPPVAALLVDNIDRRELVCDPAFASYIAERIVPWARATFPVRTDAAGTLVSGSSYGGLGAAYLALSYPEIFGLVLSQTGWFRWRPAGDAEFEWLARQVVERPTLPLRFYLDVGMLENARLDDDGPNHLVANRHMRDILRAKGYPVAYVEYHGGHDYSSLANPLVEALALLLGEQAGA
jgi:enterochelin esterase family protein